MRIILMPSRARVKAVVGVVVVVSLSTLTAACSVISPQQEHYMLRSEYYRSLEEINRTAEAEKNAIRERMLGVQADLAREEGRRIQVENEAERLRRDLAAAEARIDSLAAVSATSATTGREELDLALLSVARLQTEIETTRTALEMDLRKARADLAEATAVHETTTIAFDDLLFAAGSSRLSAPDQQRLRVSGDLLRSASHLSVIGHADDREARTGWPLAAQRAASVAAWISTNLGIPSEKITVVSRSADDPKVPNTTTEARARNRRVEVVVIQR